MGSVEELEIALDTMEGIAEDGSELDTTNVSREARVREAYLGWCKEYGKETDESRYPTFSSNYLAMEEYAKENGKTMQLNLYADCTEEQYAALTSVNGGAAAVEEVVEEAKVEAPAPAPAPVVEEVKAVVVEEKKVDDDSADVSIPYDATAKLAYEASNKSMSFAAFKTKYLANAVKEVVAKKNAAEVKAKATEAAKVKAAAKKSADEAAAKKAAEADKKNAAGELNLRTRVVYSTVLKSLPNYIYIYIYLLTFFLFVYSITPISNFKK